MAKSVITNGSVFQFRDMVMHGNLKAWNHRIAIRLANHEYLKRDGGEQEPMGAAAGRFSYRCFFIGPDCTAQYNNLVLKVRQNPRGPLIDPRLGQLNAACEGLDASEDAETAPDCIEFDIRFVEDAVDTALASEQQLGPRQYAAQVTDSLTTLTDLVDARFLGNPVTSFQAVTGYLQTLTLAATAHTTAALASIASTVPDPALQQLLGAVARQQDLFLAALTDTLSYTLESPVSLTPYQAQARSVYSGCQQLQDSITALKPPVILYPVGAAMTLAAVAQTLYGQDARGRVSEIRSLNRIMTPYWIPAGTVLRVAAPMVRQ